ncbi:hypothetical protein B1R94_21355 [Mycolicibacterium litorale]|nr:hypothetical protein B1R94_21355 [Mycolicibacterium litorale]
MFENVSADSLVEEIGSSARAENVACARRLAAVAELYRRRVVMVEDGQGRERWRIDPWDAVVAEVAAAQSSTSGAADSLVHVATCLHLRLPRVAAVFAAGTIDYRTVRLVVSRTLLAIEPEVLAAIDAELAETISAWSGLSRYRTQLAVDRLVERHDPEARRRTESRARSRHVDIRHDRHGSYLTGTLFGTDGTLLDQRLTAMARAVCDNDPRTPEQRRADALGALAAGRVTLPCACGSSECPRAESGSGASVVVHVVTEAATLQMAHPSDVHGERPEDDTCEVITSRERFAEVLRSAATPRATPARTLIPNPTASGLVLGGSTLSAGVLADLIARGLAEVKRVIHPRDAPPEQHYRPSTALADFVRCRDLTCRFPNCDHPADRCDLDHTIPYDAGGPTHASNLKALCRKHHLLKTFWCGPSGWRDVQLADGTVIWTSPSGRTYRTTPGSKLLIPSLCTPTGRLNVTARQGDSRWRGVMMPTRSRTRAQDRRSRVMAERRH